MTPQTAATGALGIGIVSSAITGFGKYEQGQQQKQAYDYNAGITLQNTNNQMVANQQRFTQLAGRQATSHTLHPGVDIASGSPLAYYGGHRSARGAAGGAD